MSEQIVDVNSVPTNFKDAYAACVQANYSHWATHNARIKWYLLDNGGNSSAGKYRCEEYRGWTQDGTTYTVNIKVTMDASAKVIDRDGNMDFEDDGYID